jgi:hypothetical protein
MDTETIHYTNAVLRMIENAWPTRGQALFQDLRDALDAHGARTVAELPLSKRGAFILDLRARFAGAAK